MWGWDDSDTKSVREVNETEVKKTVAVQADQECGCVSDSRVHVVRDYAEYTTLSGVQSHGRALWALAKIARMSIALVMDEEYVEVAKKHWTPDEMLHYQIQLKWAFVFFMVQRLATLLLQSNFVMISKNLSDSHGVDRLTYINVIMGCIMSANLTFSAMKTSYRMTRDLLFKTCVKLHHSGTKRSKYHARMVARQSARQCMYMLLICIIVMWLAFWSTLRATMAIECPCGLWTWNSHIWSSWDLLDGCAHFNTTGACYNTSYDHPEVVRIPGEFLMTAIFGGTKSGSPFVPSFVCTAPLIGIGS
jgi:hypothetical protein